MELFVSEIASITGKEIGVTNAENSSADIVFVLDDRPDK